MGGIRKWGHLHWSIKYSVEAKKRGLACGVGSSSSTPMKETTVVSDLTDDALCRLAVSTLNSGQKSWRSFTSFHVIQAKNEAFLVVLYLAAQQLKLLLLLKLLQLAQTIRKFVATAFYVSKELLNLIINVYGKKDLFIINM